MRFFSCCFFFHVSLSFSLSLACTIKSVDTDTQLSIEKVPINGVSVLSGLNFYQRKCKRRDFFPLGESNAFRNNKVSEKRGG